MAEVGTAQRADAAEASERTAGPSPSLLGERVTARAFIAGLLLSALVCAILPYNDYYVGATYLSGNFFPISALAGILVLVLAINPILISLRLRRHAWSPAEIMTVWTMMLVSAGIPSAGLARYLIPHIAAPIYYATAATGWKQEILSHLNMRLFVTDPVAVKGFFAGLLHGQTIPWGAWAGPLSWWLLFAALLFAGFFSLSTILRRPWVEQERFSFPLVQLPVLLAEAPEPGQRFNKLLRSPLLWLAVVLTTCLHTVKGLHLLFPAVPDIPVVWNTTNYITNPPWNAINDIQFAIYPLIIGFSYLLSSEVCLSFWLFYVLFKAQIAVGILYNWDLSETGVGFSFGPAFTSYQEFGGTVVAVAWLLYSMRGHLADVWRRAVYRSPDVDDAREPMPYRLALFGLIGSFGGMYLWLVFAAGVGSLMTVAVLAGAFAAFVMLSWIVAQAGMLFVSQTFVASQITTLAVGSASFSTRSLVMASVTEHIGWQDAREFMMPSLLNSFEGAAHTHLNARSMTKALAAVVVVATIVSCVASIWTPYTHGGGVASIDPWTYIESPQLPLQWTAQQIHTPTAPNPGAMLQVLLGGAFVLALFILRKYIPGFGLHPAGFLVAGSWALYMLWFSLFLGWLIKTPIMRYGGVRVYRMLLPFFLGLILGDCMNAILWCGIGLATHTGYQLLPN